MFKVIVPASAVNIPTNAKWGIVESQNAADRVLIGKTLGIWNEMEYEFE